MKNQTIFFCLCVGLCVVCAVFFFAVEHPSSTNDTYYAKPFADKIDRKQAALRARMAESGDEEEKTSNQPEIPGFKESEIHKYKGNRYETY